jgi:hypothetical protein
MHYFFFSLKRNRIDTRNDFPIFFEPFTHTLCWAAAQHKLLLLLLLR